MRGLTTEEVDFLRRSYDVRRLPGRRLNLPELAVYSRLRTRGLVTTIDAMFDGAVNEMVVTTERGRLALRCHEVLSMSYAS